MCGLNCIHEDNMGACAWDWSRGDPDPPGECAPRCEATYCELCGERFDYLLGRLRRGRNENGMDTTH